MIDGPEEDEEHNAEQEKEPERPLECSECRKPFAVYYTEIVGDMISRTAMCADCPILRHRLHGAPHTEQQAGQPGAEARLACGNCGTTLEAIRMGTPLGCAMCYEVFDDILLPEMLAANKLPTRLATTRRSMPINIGRAPGEIQEVSPSIRLLALNEALSEMLRKEDYEQAALLRDEIKQLTEKLEKTDEKK